jgi:hypothetical protein
MLGSRLRNVLLIAAGAAGLAACADEGYGGYGSMSVGYGPAGGYCDPYRGDCYGGYGYGDYYGGDPWYGWYGDYYYPGVGFYVYDRGGRRHRWSDNDRRHWEGRRGAYGNRNWNDQRWQNWNGYRQQGNRGSWSGQNRNWSGNRNGNGGNGNRNWSGGTSNGNRSWSGGGSWHHDGGNTPHHSPH